MVAAGGPGVRRERPAATAIQPPRSGSPPGPSGDAGKSLEIQRRACVSGPAEGGLEVSSGTVANAFCWSSPERRPAAAPSEMPGGGGRNSGECRSARPRWTGAGSGAEPRRTADRATVPQAGCAICLVSRQRSTDLATGPDEPRSDLLPEFWRRSDLLGNSRETDIVDAERYAIVMRMQALWPNFSVATKSTGCVSVAIWGMSIRIARVLIGP